MREIHVIGDVPGQGGTTPLTDEEERRCRAVFAAEIGARLAGSGRTTFPAHTPEERVRLFAVARLIEERTGRRIEAVPVDIVSMRFTVLDASADPAAGPPTGP
ncbi:hypothetical protein [Streptomyces fructofermentans]|uniref:hypothetical protein n=1 Tax=Streptomyces fructofermentans TaxID=152141 RepID=UPI003790BDA0